MMWFTNFCHPWLPGLHRRLDRQQDQATGGCCWPVRYVGLAMQAGALGVLQGPQDAAVTVETAPLLEVPTVQSPCPQI